MDRAARGRAQGEAHIREIQKLFSHVRASRGRRAHVQSDARIHVDYSYNHKLFEMVDESAFQ
jgi:hypothetical protein